MPIRNSKGVRNKRTGEVEYRGDLDGITVVAEDKRKYSPWEWVKYKESGKPIQIAYSNSPMYFSYKDINKYYDSYPWTKHLEGKELRVKEPWEPESTIGRILWKAMPLSFDVSKGTGEYFRKNILYRPTIARNYKGETHDIGLDKVARQLDVNREIENEAHYNASGAIRDLGPETVAVLTGLGSAAGRKLLYESTLKPFAQLAMNPIKAFAAANTVRGGIISALGSAAKEASYIATDNAADYLADTYLPDAPEPVKFLASNIGSNFVTDVAGNRMFNALRNSRAGRNFMIAADSPHYYFGRNFVHNNPDGTASKLIQKFSDKAKVEAEMLGSINRAKAMGGGIPDFHPLFNPSAVYYPTLGTNYYEDTPDLWDNFSSLMRKKDMEGFEMSKAVNNGLSLHSIDGMPSYAMPWYSPGLRNSIILDKRTNVADKILQTHIANGQEGPYSLIQLRNSFKRNPNQGVPSFSEQLRQLELRRQYSRQSPDVLMGKLEEEMAKSHRLPKDMPITGEIIDDTSILGEYLRQGIGEYSGTSAFSRVFDNDPLQNYTDYYYGLHDSYENVRKGLDRLIYNTNRIRYKTGKITSRNPEIYDLNSHIARNVPGKFPEGRLTDFRNFYQYNNGSRKLIPDFMIDMSDRQGVVSNIHSAYGLLGVPISRYMSFEPGQSAPLSDMVISGKVRTPHTSLYRSKRPYQMVVMSPEGTLSANYAVGPVNPYSIKGNVGGDDLVVLPANPYQTYRQINHGFVAPSLGVSGGYKYGYNQDGIPFTPVTLDPMDVQRLNDSKVDKYNLLQVAPFSMEGMNYHDLDTKDVVIGLKTNRGMATFDLRNMKPFQVKPLTYK